MKFEVPENVVHVILIVVGILGIIYLLGSCVSSNHMLSPWNGCVQTNNCPKTAY